MEMIVTVKSIEEDRLRVTSVVNASKNDPDDQHIRFRLLPKEVRDVHIGKKYKITIEEIPEETT